MYWKKALFADVTFTFLPLLVGFSAHKSQVVTYFSLLGMEGLFGIIFTGLLVLPALFFIKSKPPLTHFDFYSHILLGDDKIIMSFEDNAADAIVQIANS